MALRKEQVQYLVLGSLLGAGLLYLIVFFALAPLIESIYAADVSLADIEGKIKKAQTFIKRRDRIESEYALARERIQAASEKIPMPVYNNYFMNLNKIVLGLAEGLSMDVENVTDGGQPGIRDGKSRFKLYQVRVTAKSGFSTLLEYIRRLEEHNPYFSVSMVNIAPVKDTPELHTVTLLLSWLIWVEPANRPVFHVAPADSDNAP